MMRLFLFESFFPALAKSSPSAISPYVSLSTISSIANLGHVHPVVSAITRVSRSGSGGTCRSHVGTFGYPEFGHLCHCVIVLHLLD
jgi:hypothetical protein